MNKPVVSVIVPAYNRAHVLEECIKSILMQTYEDFEIIVVDDGSDDGTVELVQELKTTDDRIRIISIQSNSGAQAARNVGIKHAIGNWIAFLDSDDRYLPESLEIRMEYMQKKSLKIVYTGCYILTEDGNKEIFKLPELSGYIYSDLLKKPAPMFQSLLVHKNAIEKINYLDEKIVAYQEWDTSIRLAKYFEFGFIKTPTFIYDCREQKTISKDQDRDLTGYKQIIKKHFREIIFKTGFPCLGRHLFSIAARSKKNGKPVSWAIYLLFSGILNPGLILRKI